MDVSPTLHLDDHFKPDLFDLVNCPDYDLSSVNLGTDFGSLEDLVGRPISNNNVGDILGSTWNYSEYADTAIPPSHTYVVHDKVKVESSDKMWGGGSTTEKVVNSATGNTILITFPTTEAVAADTSDNSHIPSPQSCELFPTILTDKPFDVLVSHSHRSPASDCVSYVSAGSGYSDSGISTSLDETASPIAHQSDHVDFDRLADSAVDSMVYSPGDGGGLPSVEESTVLDGGGGGTYNLTYLTSSVSQTPDTSILEGALRGTVRRPIAHHTTHIPNTQLKTEGKTLTVMNNMTPLPPLTTVFKPETLGLPPSQPQISSSNGVYPTSAYDYPTQGTEEFTTLDSSFTKLSTASSSTKPDSESKPKKRKYTKRGSIDEPTSKGRLLHFCNVCNKGFKDKYSVNVHHRTHTGEKPFNCELCGKCFRQKAHLAKHVQIHTAPKPPGKR
ncbi:UNVERIFIED_CONTAM: hypothetical protein RMT77_005320 [Armadillidium vulgare]|nr:Zinc finger and SCAN domain-containing protein 16 [Armadillidium vulgare]